MFCLTFVEKAKNMLTKYYLEIDGTKTEIPTRCIKNWDEVMCAYKRADYSGVIRSFTSQFEFVHEAYDMLMALYLRDGFEAVAVLSLCTITDRWEWEERFVAPIDFSSITWDNYVLRVNCIDNSLAALIKANKGTKYEFVVGKDIAVAEKLSYDRIKMSNSVSHEVTGNGDGKSDGSVAMVQSSDLRRLPTYVVGDAETYENSPISYGDEADSSGSYFIKIVNPVSVLTLDMEFNYYGSKVPFNAVVTNAEIYLMKFDSANPDINGNYVSLGTVFSVKETDWQGSNRQCVGCFSSLDALQEAYPNPPQDVYAIIGKSSKVGECKAVYFTPVTINVKTEWVQGEPAITTNGHRGDEVVVCKERRFISRFDLSQYPSGSMFALVYKCDMTKDGMWSPETFRVMLKSKIKTYWESQAKPIEIDAFSPTNVLAALLNKVGDGKINVRPHIDDSDARLPKTYILAAESVRNIPGAKFYSSFQEYCSWIEAVFGYTYYISDVQKSPYIGTEPFDGEHDLQDGVLVDEDCPDADMSDLVFITGHGVFAVLNGSDGKYYTKWGNGNNHEDWTAYNDASTGKARKDKIYVDSVLGYAYEVADDYSLASYSGDPQLCSLDFQDIYFVPRSKLFDGLRVVKISNVRDLQYTVTNDLIFSTVVAGYDKQDYDAECGRDEWNFSAQYVTGIELNSNKIELISKYRADCYGLEFMAQKRAQDTTDNESDDTVFFVHCKITTTTEGEGDETVETNTLVIDRTSQINGALSDTVFNGEYSPYKCIRANEGYIAAIKESIKLKFASFDGNTSVNVDGVYGNDDIQLGKQLFTAGEIEFTTDDVDEPVNANDLIEVEYGGIVYRGFLQEAIFKYANNEAVKYKLIVKDIEL